MERRLFLLQRLSAMVMAPLVVIHLILILYAIRDGLTAAEILGRTRDNFFWATFYGLFVLTVALHAPLGLRNILREWSRMSIRTCNLLSGVFGLFLFILGARAVLAVTA